MTGENQTIVIMDTGVDYEHHMLRDNMVDHGLCYSTQSHTDDMESLCDHGNESKEAAKNCDYEDMGCGHGTHVAGIAAGAETIFQGDLISGVAKEANIYPVQVFTKVDDEHECDKAGEDAPCLIPYQDDIRSALEHMMTEDWYSEFNEGKSTNISAINMSFGGYAFEETCDANDDEINEDYYSAIQNVTSFIAPIISAAGNSYDVVSEPACFSETISIGATDINDNIEDYSPPAANLEEYWYGDEDQPIMNLVAPGNEILSAVPNDGFARKSGTSMAAPHVAGTIALIDDARDTDKFTYSSPSVDRMRNKLQDFAHWDYDTMPDDVVSGNGPPSEDYGYGRLNAFETVVRGYYASEDTSQVFNHDQVFDDKEFEGRNIFVMPDNTVTFEETVSFDIDNNGRASNLYIYDSQIEGPFDSEVIFVDDGTFSTLRSDNNFSGQFTRKIKNKFAIHEDRTFDSSENLVITGGAELEIVRGTEVSFEQGSTFHAEYGAEISPVSTSVSTNDAQLMSQTTGQEAYEGEETSQEASKNKETAGDENMALKKEEKPEEYQLKQNRPNPFNPTTNIEFQLPEAGHTVVEVYDISGRRVSRLVDEHKEAGAYSVMFDATGLASGVYIYRIRSGGEFVSSKNMTYIR